MADGPVGPVHDGPVAAGKVVLAPITVGLAPITDAGKVVDGPSVLISFAGVIAPPSVLISFAGVIALQSGVIAPLSGVTAPDAGVIAPGHETGVVVLGPTTELLSVSSVVLAADGPVGPVHTLHDGPVAAGKVVLPPISVALAPIIDAGKVVSGPVLISFAGVIALQSGVIAPLSGVTAPDAGVIAPGHETGVVVLGPTTESTIDLLSVSTVVLAADGPVGPVHTLHETGVVVLGKSITGPVPHGEPIVGPVLFGVVKVGEPGVIVGCERLGVVMVG